MVVEDGAARGWSPSCGRWAVSSACRIQSLMCLLLSGLGDDLLVDDLLNELVPLHRLLSDANQAAEVDEATLKMFS